MTRKLQLLRGTTAQNNAFTGSSGELTVDTETHELRVHDGSTAGGHVIPTKSEVDTLLAGKANDNAVVHLAGTEIITGDKYFSQPIKRDSGFSGNATSLIEANDTNGKGTVSTHAFYVNNAIVNRMATYNTTTQNGAVVDVWNYDNGITFASAPASDIPDTILITSAISKAQNGYVKLGNGVIIQWGQTAEGGTQTVNLPTAFSSAASYQVIACGDYSSTSGAWTPPGIRSKTTTTFSINTNSYPQTFWIAIGY